MSETCGCCDGIEKLTPESTANRPGLDALRYRVGTHGSFLETMKAALAGDQRLRERLTVRDADDPSIALLDAWATVGDVLTFYQERIANEGFLRTATERRSILELARLVGYRLRPGVAASVFLAYEIEPTEPGEVLIPAGARTQSIPAPGEQAQTFETSEPLRARARWNALRPQTERAQDIANVAAASALPDLYLRGTATNLKPNDVLLFVFGDAQVVRRVATVIPQGEADRTRVVLQGPAPSMPANSARPSWLQRILLTGSLPPRSPQAAARDPDTTYRPGATLVPRAFGSMEPAAASLLAAALNAVQPEVPQVQVFVMRTTASRFTDRFTHTPCGTLVEQPSGTPQSLVQLTLDAEVSSLRDGSWIVIRNESTSKEKPVMVSKVERIFEKIPVDDEAIPPAIPVTRITFQPEFPDPGDAALTVFAVAEVLELVEAPIDPVAEPIGSASPDQSALDVVLDGYYPELDAGRWLIVAGERVDLLDAQGAPVRGIRAAEVVLLLQVDQVEEAGKPYTRLTLANPLAFVYKRDTVTIHANVVKATHGETRQELLGSGDAAQTLQRFRLKQKPLTYVAVPGTNGVESTLVVRVDDLAWREAESAVELGPVDRAYVTETDDDDQTTVIFGDGERGARLPTGQENVAALYRSGIGLGGNVRAEQISLLGTRPAGVKGVINPLPASGGADRDGIENARRNTPLSLMALDRLVSVRDYADFARIFAGIGKAAATEISDGRRSVVHVTIGGLGNAPIDRRSDLFLGLNEALLRFGDPQQPLALDVYEPLLLVIAARVGVLPDYLWEKVEPRIRAALLDRFGFERQELGEDVVSSEVLRVIQAVPGVAYVDLDALDALDRADAEAGLFASAPSVNTPPVLERYVVRPGDNLYRIAQHFKSTVERLAALNRITNIRLIHPGQVLLIPPASMSDFAVRLAAGPRSRIVAHLARVEGPLVHHTVRTGDTLSGLGALFGVDWQYLQAINDIQNPNLIRVGQALVIPQPTKVLPAQLAYLAPDVPDTLILNQITEAAR